VLLMAREWKIVGGATAMAVALVAIGWWHVGSDVMRIYVATVLDTGRLLSDLEPHLHHLHSLRGFFALLIPWPSIAVAAYVAASLVVISVGWLVWTSPAPLALRFSALLLATLLVDPHLNIYDLVVLAPVFLVLADWLRTRDHRFDRRQMTRPLIASFLLPLTGPLTAWTHVQLSVLAMVWLFVVIARRSRDVTDGAKAQ
jgi:hypothetical protein